MLESGIDLSIDKAPLSPSASGAMSLGGEIRDLLLPGVPSDYLHTPIYDGALRELVADRYALESLVGDTIPLPTTEAREGYFGNRHIEYWLSGFRDARHVVNDTGLRTKPDARILDFGGASGRVIRHFPAWCHQAELFLSDINPRHVALTQTLFAGRVCALRNRGIPTLPFPDGYLDVVIAFSVFTHIDSEDTAWLLELRRVVRSGGFLYITIHDEAAWERLPELAVIGGALAAPELQAVRRQQPLLREKVVHFYNSLEDYNCNVFVPKSYVDRFWEPLFSSSEIFPARHDHQSAVILRVP